MSAKPAPSTQGCLVMVLLAILVVSPCLGLAGGVAYLNAHRNGSFTRWRSLGQPPAPVAAFLAADVEGVYAATQDGSVYHCQATSQARDACWNLAEPPYTVDERSDYEHSVIPGDPPAPPGEPVAALFVSRFYAELAIEARYILLADGTVWVWRYESGGYMGLLVLLGAPVVGLVIGVVVIILLTIVIRLRRGRAV